MSQQRRLASLLERAGCATELEEAPGAPAGAPVGALGVLLDDGGIRPMAEAGGAAEPLLGAAWLRPVPGLAGLAGIWLVVDPARRRQGHGSRLLAALDASAAAAGFSALSASVPALDHPLARFLLAHRFAEEHVEITLRRPDLADLPATSLPPHLSLRTFADPAAAIRQFLRIYDAAFGPHSWYQPYDGPAEVRAELAAARGQATDLLFLTRHDQPVGCAWLRQSAPRRGEIEPIALLPEAQGRGWGRLLLLMALARLRAAGATEARIACWRDNQIALGLYRSVGFLPIAETIYLARSCRQPIGP